MSADRSAISIANSETGQPSNSTTSWDTNCGARRIGISAARRADRDAWIWSVPCRGHTKHGNTHQLRILIPSVSANSSWKARSSCPEAL